MRYWFLNFFVALLWRKWKFKVLLAKFEDPYRNHLQNACCGIQEAACDSVNCSVKLEMMLKNSTHFVAGLGITF
jgi:hypothetical protein